MTIHINKIEGSRHSACRNDSYALTENNQGRERLIRIFPCEDLDGKTSEALGSIFVRAIEGFSNQQVREAVTVFLSRKQQPIPA